MEGLLKWFVLAIIPAVIAKKKGRNVIVWYIYGALLFLFALPHALCIKSNYQCPHCQASINPQAIICPKCSRDIAYE